MLSISKALGDFSSVAISIVLFFTFKFCICSIISEAKDAYFTQNPYSIYPSENGVDFAISINDAKAMLQEDKDEYSIPLKVLYPSVTTNMLGA